MSANPRLTGSVAVFLPPVSRTSKFGWPRASQRAPYVGQNVEASDTVSEFSDKIMLSTIASLDKARQALDPNALASAIDYLIQAKQINFFGMGGSASVALDAQHKFFRFNIPVMSYDDALMQRMVAAGANVGDVIVLISYTGRTRETVDIAQLARANGATVIGITNPDSPWPRSAAWWSVSPHPRTPRCTCPCRPESST